MEKSLAPLYMWRIIVEMQIKIPIPYKVSSNKMYAGMHFTTRKKIADIYHKSLLEFKNKLKPIEVFPVDLHFEFTMKRLLDASNTSMMAKMIEDSLVKIGILPDDTPKYVRGIHLYVFKGKKDEVIIRSE